VVQEHLESFLDHAREPDTADSAAWLVDRLRPEAGCRQRVLTFPWTMRFRLAADRRLLSTMLRVFQQELFAW
jgi:hypothetical protein